MRHKGRQCKKHKDKKTFFQSSTPFLEIVVKDETSLHVVGVSLVGVVLDPERRRHIFASRYLPPSQKSLAVPSLNTISRV